MRVSVDFSALAKTRWYEYAVRFAFGGLATALIGLIAKHFGPVVGGLFLGFPAIFPATVTLVEKREREKKRSAGINRTKRGTQAAVVDAGGTALGSLGLACFAIVVWKGLLIGNAALILLGGTMAWFAVAILMWRLGKSRIWR